MKTIITIGRQYGSGGKEVTKKLAEKLGIPFYDDELADDIAEAVNAHPDVVKKVDERATNRIIIDETARLTSLVSELLDFSRLQSGSTALDVADVCLTDCVEEIVQRVGSMTAKDGYRIVFEPAERLMIRADHKRLEQVVYNLLGNALTYTGEDKAVTLTQTVREGVVRLSVQDTGKGIPPEELPLIWRRYYRAQESHKRAVIGSGLGLSIVQSILEKHGMRYGVDSAPGEGTTFWFEAEAIAAPEATE